MERPETCSDGDRARWALCSGEGGGCLELRKFRV